MPPACVLEGRGAAALLCGLYWLPDKTGVSKGASLWHTALFAKCSVLYLLSRLTGKMRVSLDRNARFARQENGQVFADGGEQKPEPVSGVAAGICYSSTKTIVLFFIILQTAMVSVVTVVT